ncbi:MAG: aldolase/citrate lyase family protein [Terriglobia bacterium]
MQQNTTKEKLKKGLSVFGTSLTDCRTPELAVMLQAAGLDFFFVDMEHSPTTYSEIEGLCRAARGAGIIPLVRVPQNECFLITRTLDVGAMGLVVPRVHSPAEAKYAVEFMKYAPEGRRGFGMRSILTDYQWTNARDEMASANRETLVVLQIESREGLESVEEISAIPNVDALMIGPYDLSISLGIAEEFRNPVFWNAVDRVVQACEKRGIAAGIQFGPMEFVQESQRRGVRFLLYSNDVSVLLDSYKKAVQLLKAGQ